MIKKEVIYKECPTI